MSFGTGLHIMLALAYNPGIRLASADLASSLDANPVTVRRVMADLVAAGLVDTQPGPGGGAALAKPAGRITVKEVYEALGEPPFIQGHHKTPQAHCAVSACMPAVVERLNDAVAKRAEEVLQTTTLQRLIDEDIHD